MACDNPLKLDIHVKQNWLHIKPMIIGKVGHRQKPGD